MKYSKSNLPLYCPQNQSSWLKGARKNSTPVGILWHDTAAGNPKIGRYVQPDDAASDREHWIKLLGKNKYNNDWNHVEHQAGLNCWIGKLDDGTITTVQAGPWTTTPWGCGGGSKGSCNGYIKDAKGNSSYCGKHWVQFEICDDGYSNKAYFEAAFEEACQITAYICKEYGINPKGTVEFNGVTVPTILCHADSYKLKLGGNHGDVYSWFNKFGKTMDDVRNRVADILADSNNTNSNSAPDSDSVSFKVGEQVTLKNGVTTFSNGEKMQTWVPKATLYVREVRSDGTIVISTLIEGAITGVVYAKDLNKLNNSSNPSTESKQEDIVEKKILYRVRKSWEDAKSQIGAYNELKNAKEACDNAGSEYHVFDESGKIVYPEVKETPPAQDAEIWYRVRKTWEDSKSQVGAYKELANAKAACDSAGFGYHVFDANGKIVYSAKEIAAVPPIDTSKVDTNAIDPKVMWDYFKTTGLNDFAVAGIMGNLFAESSLRPCNLQQTYEKSLGMSDAEYTASVDAGIYDNFIQDKAGYGLAQWTYWSLKEEMYNYFKAKGKSIGDGQTQMEFLVYQLQNSYKAVWQELMEAASVREASDCMLLKFERPADQSENVQIKRAGYGQKYYDDYHLEEPKVEEPDENQNSNSNNQETTDTTDPTPPSLDNVESVEPEVKPDIDEADKSNPSDDSLDVTPEESKHVGNLLLTLVYNIVKIIKKLFSKN